jgi:release factor glutamine methyltransferase
VVKSYDYDVRDDDYSIGRYVQEASGLLAGVADNPRLEAELLLGLVLRKTRAHLHAWPEQELGKQDRLTFEALVRQRFSGVPMAYISGVREFWSMPLRVNRSVLIPRHETELLVEKALERIPDEDDIRVLDLGCGCGPISLAIAKERPRALVTGVDISPDALRLARLNRKILKIENVEFLESNWFDAVRGNKYHCVVTNPPYVINRDEYLLAGELRFEPPEALAAGDDGLDAIRAIIDRAHNYIVRQGWMLIEHGAEQRRAVLRLLEAQRYYDITCYQDAAGHDRVTECRFVE